LLATSQDWGVAKLLSRVREELRVRHLSPRTETQYVHWIRRYVRFHGTRHPAELGEEHVAAFLTDLAMGRRVSASTQSQAMAAVLFLYRHVLRRPMGWLQGIARARRPERVPVVLTRDEVAAVLARLTGEHWLIATLMYGSGLRLLEALSLRVKDIDFAIHEITVRRGKGAKDRVTMLPEALVGRLRSHLELVKARHQRALAEGGGSVLLPEALDRKYPAASREWGWQWVFPGRRHHLHHSAVQRMFKKAVRGAGVAKNASMPRVKMVVGHGSPNVGIAG